LPQYDRISDEKKLEWFLELEPKLIINEEMRLYEEIRIKEKKITELSQRDERIGELEKKLASFEVEKKEDEEIAREAKELEKSNPELKNIIEDYLNKELAKQLKERLSKTPRDKHD